MRPGSDFLSGGADCSMQWGRARRFPNPVACGQALELSFTQLRRGRYTHVKEVAHSRRTATGGEHEPSSVSSAWWRNEHLVRVKEMDSALFPVATRR